MQGLSAEEQAVVDAITAENTAFWMKDEAAFVRSYPGNDDILRWGYWQAGGMFRRNGWEPVVAAGVAHMRSLKRPMPEFADLPIINLKLHIHGDMAWASFDRVHPHVPEIFGYGPNGRTHIVRVLERHEGRWLTVVTVLFDAHLGDEAALLVDADGRVSWTSPLAEVLLREDPHFVMRSGRLRLRDRKSDRRLASAIGWAARLGGPLMPRRGSVPIVVENAPGAIRVAWVLAEDAGQALVMLDDRRPLESRIDQAVQIYGLSPAQGRLSLAVCKGRSLPEFAKDAGITLNTARTHLRRIFEKSGTNTQAALVVALLSLTPPR